ncbi:MAG: glycosyl hydrolase family 28 protein [Acidobacteriota bacterium]
MTRPFPLSRRQWLATIATAAVASAADRKTATSSSVKAAIKINVREFGAKGDGTTKDTAAFQQALDRCSVFGGGEVVVPAGNYRTGAIALRSNTLLRLEKDAVISGTGDFADYPVTEVRWEGKWIQGHVGLIYAIGASKIGIEGPGKIIGHADVSGRPTAQSPLRHPALIETIGCRDIHYEGFSTEYRLMWSIHPTNCEDIVIKNLNIRSTGGNGDGIDIDSCRRVRIDGCDISTGDDCIAIKSGRGSEAYQLLQTTEDVVISNCTMADSIFACIGIGSETSGGVRNVRIEHCKFTGAKTFALYIKTRVGRGAFIEDIVADDLDVSGTAGGFLSLNLMGSGLQDQDPVPGLEGIPTVRNLRFSNVRVNGCPQLVDAIRVHPGKPVDGFSLTNVTGDCAKGISMANIKNAEIRNVKVTCLTGALISTHNVTGKGLEGAAKIEGPKPVDIIPAPAVPYKLH